MSVSCFLFFQVLPLTITEMLLVEIHNDTKHTVAPKSKEVGHLKRTLQVSQDYSLGEKKEKGKKGSVWFDWNPAVTKGCGKIKKCKCMCGWCGCGCTWTRSSRKCRWVVMLLIKVVDCNDFKAEVYIINYTYLCH